MIPGGSHEVFVNTADMLGEAPLWDAAAQAFYWADIRARCIYRADASGGNVRRWEFPELVCGFSLTDRGGAIVALQSGFHMFDFSDSSLNLIANPEPQYPLKRPNDGATGPDGSFWAGTMRDGGGAETGSIYSIDSNLECRRHISSLFIPNGLAWSPSGDIFYYADSGRDVIFSTRFDIEAGPVGDRRVFAETIATGGKPDGAAVDSEGCLWSAMYGAGRVVRYRPDGRIDQAIELPARLVTACAFAGRDLDTLLVTSARQKLSQSQLEKEPLSGAVFAVRPGIRGLPARTFSPLETAHANQFSGR